MEIINKRKEDIYKIYSYTYDSNERKPSEEVKTFLPFEKNNYEIKESIFNKYNEKRNNKKKNIYKYFYFFATIIFCILISFYILFCKYKKYIRQIIESKNLIVIEKKVSTIIIIKKINKIKKSTKNKNIEEEIILGKNLSCMNIVLKSFDKYVHEDEQFECNYLDGFNIIKKWLNTKERIICKGKESEHICFINPSKHLIFQK